MSESEKRLLYYFGCPCHANTVKRLKGVAAFMVDEGGKRTVLSLLHKLDGEGAAVYYPWLYAAIREEMGA